MAGLRYWAKSANPRLPHGHYGQEGQEAPDSRSRNRNRRFRLGRMILGTWLGIGLGFVLLANRAVTAASPLADFVQDAKPAPSAEIPGPKPKPGQEPGGDPAQALADKGGVAGAFFTVKEPIRSETIEETRARTRQYLKENPNAIVIFELDSNNVRPGQSLYGPVRELADLMGRRMAGARFRVAYVPQPLVGYAVLAALACDELVMGPDASLGPISPPDEQGGQQDQLEFARNLARANGYDPDLLEAMLNPNGEELRRVRTADGQFHFVFARNLEEFQKTHTIDQNEPAWRDGQPGVISAETAREWGLSKRTVNNRSDIRMLYRLKAAGTNDDPTLGEDIVPMWIEMTGPVDAVKVGHFRRQFLRAKREKVNLLILEINSTGGVPAAASELATMLTELKGIKTVAYINEKATNVAAMAALGCDEIVMNKGGEIGDIQYVQERRLARGQLLEMNDREPIAKTLEFLASANGHNPALARAMVDPSVVIVDATDTATGEVVQIRDDEAKADPQRYRVIRVRKPAGKLLSLNAEEAVATGLASAAVADEQEFLAFQGITDKTIRKEKPTWVDSLVTTLNTPWMSWLLLFIGMFMLVVELKLPGVGLPAITSALAFLLFFWSRYLSGTAEQLDIILFVVGLICIALELFVFPGFGVFGLSGVILVILSLVMANHAFTWPATDSEYRAIGYSILQLVGAIMAVILATVALAKYLPSIPFFHHMILQPQTNIDADADPNADFAGGGGPADHEASAKSAALLATHPDLLRLLGSTGVCTTVLRPSGKARFGELLVDVIADGGFIDPNSPIEVIDVCGTRVVVKRVTA